MLGLKNQWRLLIVAAIAAVAFTVITIADNAVEDTLDTAKQAGASVAREQGNDTTFKQIGNANEAGNQVRDGAGNARYDECLRSAAETHRSFCERYRTD